MSAYKPQICNKKIRNKKILFLKYYKPFVYILRECGKSTPHPSRKLATFPHWGRLLECLLSEMNYAAKQEFIRGKVNAAGLTHENFSQKYVKHNGEKRYFDTVDKV